MKCSRLHAFLDAQAENRPAKIALVASDLRTSYAGLKEQSDTLACRLLELGVKPGDRVAAFLDNSLPSVVTIYGTLKAGAVFVLLNGGLRAPKLRAILNDSGARVLVTTLFKHKHVSAAIAARDGTTHVVWTDTDRKPPAQPGVTCHLWNAWMQAPETPEGLVRLIAQRSERRHFGFRRFNLFRVLNFDLPA